MYFFSFPQFPKDNPPSYEHVTFLCSEEDNLHKYSHWQINCGRKCRFFSERASCLSSSLSYSSVCIFVIHNLLNISVFSLQLAAYFCLSAVIFWDFWQFYCLFLLHSFYFSLAIIGRGLKWDMLSCAVIWHKFNNTCTRLHTHTHKRLGAV